MHKVYYPLTIQSHLLKVLEMPSTNNFDIVEGEWKNFVFKRITHDDHSRVLEHFRKYFLLEEPTCQLLGCTDLFVQQMEATTLGLLKDNLSFLVEEKTSKEVNILIC